MSMLLDNLNDVEKRIQAACDRSGRKREEVLLVAVSKTKPVEMIEEIMAAGIVEFGENKPQELRDKYEVLPKNLHFHMIGHLQTNKIKYVIDRAVLIHSIVPSVLQKRSMQRQKSMTVSCRSLWRSM